MMVGVRRLGGGKVISNTGIQASLRGRSVRIVIAAALIGTLTLSAEPVSAADSGAEVSGECRVGDDKVFFQAGGQLLPRKGRLTARLLTPNGTVIAKRTDTKPNDHDFFRVLARIEKRSGVSTYQMKAVIRASNRNTTERISLNCVSGSTHRDRKALGSFSSCHVGKERVRFGARAESDRGTGTLRVQLYYLIQTETTRKVVVRKIKDTTSISVGGDHYWEAQANPKRRSGIRKYWARGRLRVGSGVATSYYYCTAG